MSDEKFMFWGGVLFVPFLFLLWLILAPWHGYALMKLWEWFVVPLGVRPLPFWEAIGLILVVRFVVHSNTSSCVEKEGAWKEKLVYPIAAPAISLACGWLTLQVFGP